MSLVQNEIKDFKTEKPNFAWYQFGPFKWGTRYLRYQREDGLKERLTIEGWEHHNNTMLLVPDTNEIIENAGIWWNDRKLFDYDSEWINVSKVVAQIKATIGNSDNTDQITKTFNYRDIKLAKESWSDIVNTADTEKVRVFKRGENNVTIVRQLDEDVLSDPDLYIKNIVFLKKIKSLHQDHNSRVEKWEINWIKT